MDIKSESKADDVGPGPAPSPCKILSPTGLPCVITAFIAPLTFPIYEFLLTKHGWTVSNNWLFIISEMPNNLILFGAFHPSPRNVNTGRLNFEMMVEFLRRIKSELKWDSFFYSYFWLPSMAKNLL